MGRVQQKVLFSHFSVVKCKIWKEIMNIWNYDICVWHPPTLIYVLNSYVKEIRFWNQYPPTIYAMSSKSAVFFWRLPLVATLVTWMGSLDKFLGGTSWTTSLDQFLGDCKKNKHPFLGQKVSKTVLKFSRGSPYFWNNFLYLSMCNNIK